MQVAKRNHYMVLAEAFCYPSLGLLERLAQFATGGESNALSGFLAKVQCISLSEWEELYTRTFDLNPPVAPYIGFQTWGENYHRGTFLAMMNREVQQAGIETEGELPDHLIPVLRYLGKAAQPIPELVEVLDPALQRMQIALRKADPGNLYIDLLEAVQECCKGLNKEAV
jgi:nitrate reductase delta subunit